jgi:hypothetical protein
MGRYLHNVHNHHNESFRKADGSAENLPTLNRDEPEQQKRHSMELLVDAPMNMGLGIKRY